MFEPIRGGTRGGQAEFKWSDVSADKDREHYLGHSINAPTGRWQKNKDVHWYNRDKDGTQEEKDAEKKHIKQLEADALAVALGFEPGPKDANKGPSLDSQAQTGPNEQDLQRAQEKEEKRRRKAERKEEKRAKKLAKLERQSNERGGDSQSYYRRSYRDRSSSRSPRLHSREHDSLRRSHSPNRRPIHRLARRTDDEYDAEEKERERERDRRRWEMNVRRELPSRHR